MYSVQSRCYPLKHLYVLCIRTTVTQSHETYSTLPIILVTMDVSVILNVKRWCLYATSEHYQNDMPSKDQRVLPYCHVFTFPCPVFPRMISGAMYSMVPQKEYVRSFWNEEKDDALNHESKSYLNKILGRGYHVNVPPLPETPCWARNLSALYGLHCLEECFPIWYLCRRSQAV